LIEEDGDDHNDDVRIDALDADWHLAIERYKRGAGIADKRAHRAGAASRPVDDGLTTISLLYADLSPDVVLIGCSATELRYKNCVDVTLDRTASVVNVSWLHRKHARRANVVFGGAFTKTNVKSTVVAGEKPILEHSEATIATISDALTTAQDNNFIYLRDQHAENLPV
jgi:hypothetical protein